MKTFSVIGDSISTFDGFIPSYCKSAYPCSENDVCNVDETWWYILGSRMGWKLEVNQSYSGSRVTETGSRPIWSACISDRRLSDLGRPDVMLILAGTNDFGQEDDLPSLSLFRQSYFKLLSQIKKRLPTADIVCMTPLQRTSESLNKQNSMGWTQLDLAEAVREVASGFSARLIDLALFQINEGDGILADGIHPTRKGMQLISDIAVEVLVNQK